MREEMLDSAPLTVICNRLNLKGTRGAETSAKVNGPIFARHTDLHEPPCFSRRRFPRVALRSAASRRSAKWQHARDWAPPPKTPPLHHIALAVRDVLCFALV